MDGQFDSRAIKSELIPTMQSAIETYTSDVETYLNKIKAYELGQESGIYGKDQITTVKTYLDDTCTEINRIVRYFDDYQEKLDIIKAEYETKQGVVTVADVETAKEADPEDLVTVNRME